MPGTSTASGTYEVQVYANGSWRAVSAFEDRMDAIQQAQELAENPRFLSVKVIKEQFDELRSLYVQKTVYRSSALREERPELKEKKAEETFKRIGERRRERVREREVRIEAKKAERREKWSGTRFALGMTLRLLLILSVGLGILYWILAQY